MATFSENASQLAPVVTNPAPGAVPEAAGAAANSKRHPTRNLGITCGQGLTRPQGRFQSLATWTPAAVADALRKLAGHEAWWTPHCFDGHYRQEARWQAAVALALDLDYHDAKGDHVALPEALRAKLGALALGNLGHATPRGHRLIALLATPINDPDEYAAAIAAFAAQARDALDALGVLATDGRNGLDVDAACHDRARLLFAPKATVSGHERAADVVVTREQLYDVAELLTRQETPAEPVEPSAPAVEGEAELPAAPLDALPAPIGDYMGAVAAARCVDSAMPFTFGFGIAAAAIGRAAEIELRHDWREIAPLWLGHVAAPGKQKSPTLKAMAAPLYAHDNDLDAEHAAALAEWECLVELALDKKQKPPERPRRKQSVIADCTIEALGDVLEVSPRCAGIYDELGALFDSMGCYKKTAGPDRQNWLSLHAGARITTNRKGKDPLIVECPRLGIIGATTPSTAARVLSTLNGDGLVDRFFLTQSRPVANRFNTPPVPAPLREAYLSSVAALCGLPTLAPRVLTLKPEAAEVFGEFYESLDVSSVPVHLQGVLGKLAGHVGRIALTLALWGDSHNQTVNAPIMQSAIRIAQWFAQHTAALRSAQILSRRAAALVAWLGKHEGRAALRDVLRAGVAGVKSMDEAEALANEAARAGAVAWSNGKRDVVLTGARHD